MLNHYYKINLVYKRAPSNIMRKIFINYVAIIYIIRLPGTLKIEVINVKFELNIGS